MRKSSVLKKLFASSGVVRIVGAHDAIGSKLAQKHGFDGIWASGLEISTSHGVPDANILSMTDFLHAARVMNDSTSLPIVCDCDTGFGNAANVQHLVRKYEAAGVAAVVIEDKIFPKVNSFVPGRQELAPIEEFAGKIRAAKDAQTDPDFMVFARVEALIAGWGLEEALRRAAAYADAGADGIVIHSKMKTPAEIYEFAERWGGRTPLVAIPTTYPGVSAAELGRHGFKMVIYANQGLRAAVKAVGETFAAIAKEDSSASVESSIASMAEIFEMQGMNDMKESEKKYAGFSARGVILSAADHKVQPGFSGALQELPLCMVDVAGKPLVARQLETLQACGVNRVTVVGGHLAGRIRAEGAELVVNAEYGDTGIAYSFFQARPTGGAPCLLVYGDVIHDRRLIEQLLKSPHPITIVIDRAYRSLPQRDKKVDLVYAETPGASGENRKVAMSAFKEVRRIGCTLPAGSANYEFAGVALFKEGGLALFQQAWEAAQTEFEGRRFYASESVRKADLNDMLQFLIDRGVPVHGLEVEHGWSEIHSPEDLERARKHFTGSAKAVHS